MRWKKQRFEKKRGFPNVLTSRKGALSPIVTSFTHPRTLLWVAAKRQTDSSATSAQRIIGGGRTYKSWGEQKGMQHRSLISCTQGEADPALTMTNVAVNSSGARCWHPANTRLHFPLRSYTANFNGPRPTAREMSVRSLLQKLLLLPSPSNPFSTVSAVTQWPLIREYFSVGTVYCKDTG